MAHHLNAIITDFKVINFANSQWHYTNPIALNQGLYLIPITELFELEIQLKSDLNKSKIQYSFNEKSNSFKEFTSGTVFSDETKRRFVKEFSYYNIYLEKVLKMLSKTNPVAYIETDYDIEFGRQSSILFEDGTITDGPNLLIENIQLIFSENVSRPINRVLQKMGVIIDKDEIDEFDSIGLRKYRRF